MIKHLKLQGERVEPDELGRSVYVSEFHQNIVHIYQILKYKYIF